MIGLVILSSLLISSSLSKIIAKLLTSRLSIKLFSSDLSSQIPGFSENLAEAKLFDLISFLVFLLISSVIFLFNFGVFKVRKSSTYRLLLVIYFLFSILVFLETNFVGFSGKTILFQVVVAQLALLLIPSFRLKSKFSKVILINGLITGYWGMILINNISGSTSLPILSLLSMPIVYVLLEQKYPKKISSYLHPVLLLSIFSPFNVGYLLALFLVLIIFPSRLLPKHSSLDALYPLLAVFIFAFNPLFYFGSFDSVEEGFWLAWLQRSINGQVMYRDFFAYHPPLISWGLSLFTRFTSHSIYHFRAYLHILQLIGVFVIYLVAERLIKAKAILIIALFIILSLFTINVRNNIEIRLAMGILPTLGFYYFLKTKKVRFLILSGISTALAIFTSLEVGVAAFLASLSVILVLSFIEETKLREALLYFLLGISLVSLPVLSILYINNSLNPFVEQMQYVSNIFSAGYRNLALEQVEPSTLLFWGKFINSLGSTWFAWEFAKMGVVAGGFFAFHSYFKKRNLESKFAGVIFVFSMFLFRPALGRSDIYHILTVSVLAILLLAYVIENVAVNNWVSAGIMLFVALFVFRGQTQMQFLESQVIKYQSFANPSGDYPSYKNERSQIMTNIDIDTAQEDALLDYIINNTSDSEKLFVFPQRAEIYFLTDRQNATSYDTPFLYFTNEHQLRLVNQLEANKPKFIIYNSEISYSGLTASSLALVNEYIIINFEPIEDFGDWKIMTAL